MTTTAARPCARDVAAVRRAGALFGRERMVGEVLAALQDARIVTLVGAGGIGKTRIAIEAAARWMRVFLKAPCSCRSRRSRARASCRMRLRARSASRSRPAR